MACTSVCAESNPGKNNNMMTDKLQPRVVLVLITNDCSGLPSSRVSFLHDSSLTRPSHYFIGNWDRLRQRSVSARTSETLSIESRGPKSKSASGSRHRVRRHCVPHGGCQRQGFRLQCSVASRH